MTEGWYWERAVCEELGLDQDKVVSVRAVEGSSTNRVGIGLINEEGTEQYHEFDLRTF